MVIGGLEKKTGRRMGDITEREGTTVIMGRKIPCGDVASIATRESRQQGEWMMYNSLHSLNKSCKYHAEWKKQGIGEWIPAWLHSCREWNMGSGDPDLPFPSQEGSGGGAERVQRKRVGVLVTFCFLTEVLLTRVCSVSENSSSWTFEMGAFPIWMLHVSSFIIIF